MKIKIKNRFIDLTPDNLRGFSLYTNSNDIILKRNDKYSITAIIIEDSYRIKLGDVIEIDNYKYTVNLIQQINNVFYCIQESLTKTSQFILPLLGNTFSYYNFNKNLYNSYLSDCYTFIYLVYKFSNTEEYLELEDKLTKHIYFKEIIDPNPELVIIKFKIPDKYWEDINLILEGNYSSINNNTKAIIYKFHGLSSNSVTFKTLYNSKLYRDELSAKLNYNIPEDINLTTKPFKDKEIWNLQNILKGVEVGIPI